MGKKEQYDWSEDSSADSPSESSSSTTGEDAAMNGETADSSEVSASETPNSSTSPENKLHVDIRNLPHKLRREDVKDDRKNIAVHVQPDTMQEVRKAERLLQDEFDGERVYVLDVYEAIMMNGLRTDDGEFDAEGVLECARELGYGLTSQ